MRASVSGTVAERECERVSCPVWSLAKIFNMRHYRKDAHLRFPAQLHRRAECIYSERFSPWLGGHDGRYLLALLLVGGFAPAGAQETQPQDEVIGLDELQVVGSRTPGRSAADSPVPVDIIDGDSFQNYGVRDLNNLLAATIPSYNITQHAIGDANTLVRPAKLRGLPPDSTLVLINGKRRHRSSAISIFTFGQAQGAHGADIRSIPAIALKRVEVLRDGAGAQYGSDAVAGVMNFVLRDAPEGGSIEARWGQYYQGDGDSVSTAANIGLPLTDAGFANFSFEFVNSGSTDRSYVLDVGAGR